MANGLTMTDEEMNEYFKKLAEKKNMQEPNISLGADAGLGPTTGGTQTVSQEKAKFYSRLNEKSLTPFQKRLLGGSEEIAKEKEAASKLIESEKSATMDQRSKEEDRSKVEDDKLKTEEPKRLWRAMPLGQDRSQDTFHETKEEAEMALQKSGGKGAVGGVTFKAKTPEEYDALKEKYIQTARNIQKEEIPSVPKQKETEEERVKRKISEVNPLATEEQKAKYWETLSASRAKGAEREAASKEKYAKFKSDIAAKEASDEQLSQYNQQLSLLKKAYSEASKSGDYIEQYRIGDFINLYEAGIPKEIGARQKAARSGIIAQRNKELEEKMRRDREARISAQRTSMANPDYSQFSQSNNPQYAQGVLQTSTMFPR